MVLLVPVLVLVLLFMLEIALLVVVFLVRVMVLLVLLEVVANALWEPLVPVLPFVLLAAQSIVREGGLVRLLPLLVPRTVFLRVVFSGLLFPCLVQSCRL